ncbi:MAG: hypothetical protein FJ271_09995 [Planctomycetes bacterium]|nr:hypothetical protein [Planctomycetota bacterium]
MAIILACLECQERIKVRDESAGRKVRCPHCGATVPVPRTTADDDDDRRRPAREAVRSADRPARPRGATRRRDEDDDLDDDMPRSRRRRREAPKSNAGLVIALCAGGGVLVIGGVVLLIMLLGKSDGPRRDRQAELDMKIIGLAYHNHLDMFRKAPLQLEDLQRVGVEASAMQRLRDGSVRTISKEEFQQTAKARGPNNEPPIVPKNDSGKNVPKDPTAGWSTVLSRSNAFSIKMPPGAAPSAEKQDTSPEGAQTVLLSREMPDKTAFQVMLARFPPNTLTARPADAALTGVRDRLKQSLAGNIRREGSGPKAGHAWRELQMDVLGNGHAQIRMMVVRDDLYQLMVLGPASSPYHKDAAAFFQSLVLREATPKIPKDPPASDPEPNSKDDDSRNDLNKLLGSGKHKQAAELLEKLAQRAPPAVRSRMRADAAMSWLKAQDKDRALAAARSAAADPPASKIKSAKHRWHRTLGEVFLETGQYAEAVEHLQRALENATNTNARNECQRMLDNARAKNSK